MEGEREGEGEEQEEERGRDVGDTERHSVPEGVQETTK